MSERATVRLRADRAGHHTGGRGARWLTGQEHATETAKRRWWDTLAAMRWLTVQVNPKTHR